MFLARERELVELRATTSTLERRIQQLSAELLELRSRMPILDAPDLVTRLAIHVGRVQANADRKLDRFLLAIRSAAEAAILQESENHRRGRAGGLARARTAWRYFDGTFMPESEKREAYLQEYERYAIGGRARAATALRAPDGTFAPT